jgi:hypothetical protein
LITTPALLFRPLLFEVGFLFSALAKHSLALRTLILLDKPDNAVYIERLTRIKKPAAKGVMLDPIN